MKRHWVFASSSLCAAFAAAAMANGCSDANQTPTGGDPLFDASPPVIPKPTPDAGADADAGATCEPTDAGDATWSALYADFFGPSGTAKCGSITGTDGTNVSSCHHDASGTGAQSSGFVCGDTVDSCYQGITSPQAKFLGTQVVVPCAPADSYLLTVLRHDGGGIMPLFPPTVVFSDTDMARVRAWVAAGAPPN